MKIKLFSQTVKIRLSAWLLFAYATIDSMFINGGAGVIGILLLLFYLFNNRRDKYAHKVSFMLSLIFIVGAVIVDFFDGNGILGDAIRTMSVWVYLLMLTGAVQLLIGSRTKEQ
ncbi:hypothetical protein ACFL2C_00090 [Patescibacteria group bacterium]